MMSGLRFADWSRNAEFFNARKPLKTKIAKILKEAAEFWKSQGIIAKMPSVNDLISTTATEYFSSKGKH